MASKSDYRLVKHYDKHPLHVKKPKEFPPFVEWYAIHEVCYNPDGSIKEWIKRPIDLSADETDELKSMMRLVSAAFRKPMLEVYD